MHHFLANTNLSKKARNDFSDDSDNDSDDSADSDKSAKISSSESEISLSESEDSEQDSADDNFNPFGNGSDSDEGQNVILDPTPVNGSSMRLHDTGQLEVSLGKLDELNITRRLSLLPFMAMQLIEAYSQHSFSVHIFIPLSLALTFVPYAKGHDQFSIYFHQTWPQTTSSVCSSYI